jgi:signal transduction histidine kinase
MSTLRSTLAFLCFSGLPFLACAQDETELSRFQSFFEERQTSPVEKALHEANLKLDQSREIGDSKEEARALRDLGLIHLNRAHDYEKAVEFLIGALAIEDSMKLVNQQVLTYIALARTFEVVGDFYKSAQFLDQAAKLDPREININTLAMIFNNLGRVNAAMGVMDEALKNFQDVLRYRTDIDKRFEAEALLNLGHLYTARGDYKAALENHKKALAVTRALGDRRSEALSLNDIGILYGLMKNDEKSLANHEVSLEIRRSLNDKRGIAESYNNIALFYLRKGETEKARANGLFALEQAREAQAQEQMLKSYDLLSQSFKTLGDFQSALTYKELSQALHEFIENEAHERQLLETQNRYLLGKKETEIQNLDALRLDRERELAAGKKFRNVLYLLVALGVVSAGLLLILYLVKRRANRILSVAKKEVQQQNVKLQQLNNTKDKFFSIISHDLKGPLNSLTSFSRLLIDHTDSLSREEIQALAKDLDKSVKNLLTLLENLLEWSRSQTGNIDFTPEVFDVCELLEANKLLLDSQGKSKQVSIEVLYSGESRVRLHKQSVNTVIRNLLSNAIKFTSANGTIRLGLRHENSRLEIYVADNGVGMSAEVVEKLFRLDSKHSTRGTSNEKGTGLGLILCRDFIEKNGGHLRVQSAPGKGSVFTCSFPDRVCLPAESAIAASQSL